MSKDLLDIKKEALEKKRRGYTQDNQGKVAC